MEDIKDPEYIQIGLEKLYKGSIMMVNTVTLLQDELSKTAAATAAFIHQKLDNQEALEKLHSKWKKVMVELKNNIVETRVLMLEPPNSLGRVINGLSTA
ncbi:hypothetical protein PAAG_12665 [Paracoccidioides lutzii Pb01]|uniref:Uncharacterized protein n=1 Tax=Paracoccidioides lutzii (strain ATCC MYA-826 / Pb01) TaxID=502779 RepID=A0A0A2V3J3_PARBA|nr:hypothetical protein PAAG_12665 [Paracoccidioides lutzii Pb01]KGQ00675.1 hypothetical protein PAAG_12665 [Paracoccidioides lutzii Pb01]